MKKSVIVTAAAAALASPATAQFAGEHLAAPADPHMVLGAKTASAPMQEYVARDESVEAWTRMVTVVQLPWRPGITPASLLDRFKAGWLRSCPGSRASETSRASLAGHEAADVRLDCPINPRTRQPETMFGRVVLGDQGLHMVQAAVRRSPTASDLTWATRVIQGSVLCPTGGGTARCEETRDPPIGHPL